MSHEIIALKKFVSDFFRFQALKFPNYTWRDNNAAKMEPETSEH